MVQTAMLLPANVQPNPPNMLALLMIGIYLTASIAIGYLVRQHADTASKFLHARGMLPSVVAALAFLAANCGAFEIVGIPATSAKYEVLALHFYWIGAIPAMVFLALFIMPVYSRSGAMTVLDFIRIRYSRATHILCSLCLTAMMVLIAGISLFAISTVLQTRFGWNFSLISVHAARVGKPQEDLESITYVTQTGQRPHIPPMIWILAYLQSL